VAPQGGSGPYTYQWAFGDGGTSTVQNGTHVYGSAGNNVATVQVRSGSEQVTCSKNVTVLPPATPTFPLTVSRQGAGSGIVTSAPAGIDCGSTCTADYPQGTLVSLTAQADASSLVVGWSGACSGAGACNVTMDAARTVSARFDLRSFTLYVNKTPLSSILGSVKSTPAGINCGLLCASTSASFLSGTVVTLTATSGLLASFQGWSGDCTGTGPCMLTMDGDKSVTANFGLLLAATSSHTDGGGDVDLGLMRSVLKIPGVRGEVTLNGRTVLLTREGVGQVGLRAPPGNNLVEAWVREAAGSGLWRFEFDPAAIEPGALRVLAGEPLAVAPDSVTFRLTGRPGERVSFAVRARATRADAPAP
jgi:PKD repeat protein